MNLSEKNIQSYIPEASPIQPCAGLYYLCFLNEQWELVPFKVTQKKGNINSTWKKRQMF